MKIYDQPQIKTPHLIVRPVQLGDEFYLNKAVNNSLELLQKWLPWAKDPSIEATRSFIQQGVFAWESGCIVDFPMVIINKEDQKIIGASGYTDRSNLELGIYEIGYWCDVNYQGKGLVTESVNALTQYALKELAAKTVILRIEVDNEKSIAVAKRLGFINRGTRPSVTKENATDYYFVCERLENLPVLSIFCNYKDYNNINNQIIIWAKEELNITDLKVLASSKVILQTPWSGVMAINTGETNVYLKHMPEQISKEATIINILGNKFNANVPEVIAENKKLNCFLMKDAGKSLRTILKQNFDDKLLCKAIEQFTLLQLSVANNIDILLEIGVPDWRLDKLPDLFKNFITQKDILIEDGLSAIEITELNNLLPTISFLCQKLSDYAIKDTFVQCDFNDNNTLIDENSSKITHIDLGEIVISHPFFSLVNCLHQMNKHYALTEQDDVYLKIKNACLKNFMSFNSQENILDAFKLAQLLWFIYDVLGQYRLILACNKEQLMLVQHGKLSKMLKEFKNLVGVLNL